MKLGIINGWDEGSFKYVASLGLHAVEFCCNHNYDSMEVAGHTDEILSYSKKYDVAVGSIGRWGQKRIDDDGNVIESALQHDKNLIDAASRFGCPVFNCGCNYTDSKTYLENCEIAINYFKTLIDYAKDKNVKIAVYNCDWANFVYNDKAWSIIMPALPELGIKYDTSHCLGRRGDYLSEMKKWGKRIYHFHLKGSLYIDGLHYDDPPVGLDQTNWGAVMDVLYTVGYNGMLSIEPHSGYWMGVRGQWGVEFTINYIKPYIMPEDYTVDGNTPYMP